LPWRKSLDDPLAGCKSLNYAASALGLEAARSRGAQEGLWLNARGHLAEGCISNVFVIQGRRVFTPSERDGILPGIVRHLTVVAARKLGLDVHEGKIRLVRLERASEAFLTSSVRGIRPIVTFEGAPVGKGSPGPWTARIAAEVAKLRSP
jgi:branched-subunit amino acid aminotransferase/4-amino-4-deoxychorismate lyase